jgi:hypothetical protein
MKKLTYHILLIALVFAFSCRKAKNMKDYYPDVNTVSATVNQDGGVDVQATIVSAGDAPIGYAGFCMDTVPDPKMLSNQVVLSGLSGKDFTITYDNLSTTLPYKNFDPKKTYYFRSWATNANGYTYGNTISLSNIKGTPVTPPCSLTPNSLNLGTGMGTDNVSTVTGVQQNFTWDIDATGYNTGTVHFQFGSKPRTKVFTTTTNTSPGLSEVYISFYSGFISGALNDGNKVYVNEKSPGVYEITVCQGSWMYNTSTFYMDTRLVSPT